MNLFYKILRLFCIRTHRAFRLTLRAIALLVGLICAYQTNKLMELQCFECAFWWYFGVVAAGLLEFVFADVLADRSFPFDTERKLAMMEKRLGGHVISTISSRLKDLILTFSACDNDRISATVHIVTELSPTADDRVRQGLLQLTDYVGPEGGKKGRITLITQGIIGRCVRTGRMETVDFASSEEYYQSMIRGFGFTFDEATRHSATGRSYLAHPLFKDNLIVGVLYLFTSEPQVFPCAVDLKKLQAIGLEIVNYLDLAELI